MFQKGDEAHLKLMNEIQPPEKMENKGKEFENLSNLHNETKHFISNLIPAGY